MIGGTVYGVVLNDRTERVALSDSFQQAPYAAPPLAPVVYIKPRTCWSWGGAPVFVPADLPQVEAAATVALLFDSGADPVAAALAIDVSEPAENYYRPAVKQRSRDGFLPMGCFGTFDIEKLLAGSIVSSINAVEVHRWSLDRLVRDIPTLIADLRDFMTLGDGDVLLVGLPGDAPLVEPGQSLRVEHSALPTLEVVFTQEEPA